MKKIPKFLSLGLILALLLTGCGDTDNNKENNSNTGGNNNTPNTNENANSGNKDDSSNGTPMDTDFSQSEADMFSKRDFETTYRNGIKIQLNGDSAFCDSKSVAISGSTVTIKNEGTYILSGTLDDGMIIVDANDSDKLQLVFDDVTIHNETSAPICILEADKVFITLAKDSSNTLSNGGSFSNKNNANADLTNVDGTVFSKQDLTFNGSGSLTITSPAGHGIVCKDDLVFTGGTYAISCASHGMDANDSVRIKDAEMTIDAGKDGIHAENSDDASLGFIYVASGNLNIEAEGDGISSGYYTRIEDGSFDILAGGGYENGEQHSSDHWGNFGGGGMHGGGMGGGRPGGRSSDTTNDAGSNKQSGASSNESTSSSGSTDDGSSSMKGIKSNSSILINGGTFSIDTADDAIHSNLSVYINNGAFEIASGDDGIHAEEELTIIDGKINITQSYEGLEGVDITISGGDIDIRSTDDGMNAAGGVDSSGTGGRDEMSAENNAGGMGGPGGMGGHGGMGGPGGMGGGMSGKGSITISGGNIFMYAQGDGLDANGIIEITGGYTIVTGPTQGDTAILDYDTTATISGGTFIGAGSTMMAQIFSDGTQGTMAAQGSFLGGTEIRLEDADGKEIISYTPETSFQFIIISTPDIVKRESYTMYVGSASGTFEAY